MNYEYKKIENLNYFESNREYFPVEGFYYNKNGECYTFHDIKSFTCHCGVDCVTYGYYKFSSVCIKCAISELTAELIWEWLFLKDGLNCKSRERFDETSRFMLLQNYGNYRLRIFKLIYEQAYKKFRSICRNIACATDWVYNYGNHWKWNEEYEGQNHIQAIKCGSKILKSKSDYKNMVLKLSKETGVLPRYIPKEMVFTNLNLLNINRLTRQRRKKQCLKTH